MYRSLVWYQLLVERSQALQRAQLQQHGSDEVIKVQQREKGLFL